MPRLATRVAGPRTTSPSYRVGVVLLSAFRASGSDSRGAPLEPLPGVVVVLFPLLEKLVVSTHDPADLDAVDVAMLNLKALHISGAGKGNVGLSLSKHIPQRHLQKEDVESKAQAA